MTHHSVPEQRIIGAVPKPSSHIERRKAELRQEIIETAFDCFAEKGYHATGIADIATRLGIGHGTFYRYFENKRDIIDHVIDDLAARIIDSLGTENAPDAATTLEEYRAQVGRIGSALNRIFLEDRRVARLLLFQATGIDAELTLRLYGLLDTADALTAGYLEHGVELGYLRADLDTANTAKAVTGMILAAILHGLRTPDETVATDLTEAIRRLLIDGVRKE
ncbi:TetR/AcrR family transcriptional regulator [Nocardia terpenica]|nr:TetR/AcrR family transcriptional regulator [Nocardia terpenica]MBF6102693.1 TetR/AcrR family transcriptional regulator [Nocardia terpenica]MBF6111116.1 TetR/AcrR family transcriptional regulator [Nocardia terpenica]MBF6117247.1 TetR/AcrR family transcriptional regulator [Nocardia terpenica]MBF6150912.1 TetR/AcrR family transcriptional regulator [Nocardia terpenica]